MSSSVKKLPAAKSVTSRRTKTLCGVCRSQIVEGKEEALLCEGDCGQWLHRGCASVPQERYKELANSDEPFVCLHCSNVHLKRTVDELTSTVVSLKEELKEALTLRECLTSIANDVSALKQTVNVLNTPQPPTATATETAEQRCKPQTYAAVTRPTTHQDASKQPQQPTGRAPASSVKHSNSSNRRHGESRGKIKVEGARRIWGTIKNCSSKAVLATISKLTSTRLQLTIKRKTKELASNKMLWWFVVHGAERDLSTLETEWEKVHDQTLWKLQDCHMPASTGSDNCSTETAENHALLNANFTSRSAQICADQVSPDSPTKPQHELPTTNHTPSNPSSKSISGTPDCETSSPIRQDFLLPNQSQLTPT